MLDDGAKLYSAAAQVTPRDEIAKQGMRHFDQMEAPEVERPEEVFFHEKMPGENAFVMLENEKLGLAAILHFDAETFPLLCEWKCMRAGDYALGLEPTTFRGCQPQRRPCERDADLSGTGRVPGVHDHAGVYGGSRRDRPVQAGGRKGAVTPTVLRICVNENPTHSGMIRDALGFPLFFHSVWFQPGRLLVIL